MSASPARLQGFGAAVDSDAVTANVHFDLLLPRETLPQWQLRPNTKDFAYPGSDPPKMRTQLLGWTPATVTWRLSLADLAAYRRLAAMVTTTQTLTVLAGIQWLPADYIQIGGVGYESLPQTTLLTLSEPSLEIGEGVEVDATFRRHIDPVTFTVVSP